MAIRKTASGYAIVCTRNRKQSCAYCAQPGTQLCDYVTDAETGATCDKPMCIRHAKRVAYQTDYCPEHVAASQKQSA